MRRIPLFGRDGELRGHTLVDDSDYTGLVTLGAWTLNAHEKTSYARRRDVGAMHRYLLGLSPGDAGCVDHIDGNGLNNQRANLRIATHAQNMQNQQSRGGASQFRGVSWSTAKQCWAAKGCGELVGWFDDELEAAIAAQAWRDEHMPFARPDAALVAALEGKAA